MAYQPKNPRPLRFPPGANPANFPITDREHTDPSTQLALSTAPKRRGSILRVIGLAVELIFELFG